MSICSFALEKDRLTVCTKGKGKQITFYNCLLKLGGTNNKSLLNAVLTPQKSMKNIDLKKLKRKMVKKAKKPVAHVC